MDPNGENVTDGVESQNETVEQTTEDSRESTIGKISNILLGRNKVSDDSDIESVEDVEDVQVVENDESIDDKAESEDEEADDEYVDEKFVSAARNYGWTDDQIRKYAQDHDEADLVKLAIEMGRYAQDDDEFDDLDTELDEDQEKPDDLGNLMTQLEEKEIDGDLKNLISNLASRVMAAEDAVKQVSESAEATASKQMDAVWHQRLLQADELFDGAAKDFAELGATKDLTRMPDGSLSPHDPSVKIREEIFNMAKDLLSLGRPWSQALGDALRWYKGGREADVESKVLRKIKKNAKNITPRKDKRRTTKKHLNEVEEKAEVVNAVLRKYNTELPM